MSRPDVWVSVTCTDRASSLRALAMDLTAQAAVARVRLTVLVNDNSVATLERDSLRAVVADLRTLGHVAEIAESPRSGASIAASRRSQQAQIRAHLATSARPSLVWMLDDDVRLSHVHWNGERLVERPLHCHLTFLLEMTRRYPHLDVLVGEVSGDAPIPVAGSLVSRLADLAANLGAMFRCEPDGTWTPPDAAHIHLRERDAYYDLSVDRAVDSWSREVLWLPWDAPLTTSMALAQMLDEVEHIPRGGAFSRPLLAEPERFAQLTQRPLRGANAVFFNVDSCLQHPYPCATVGGLETRRSDMIGTRLLVASGTVVRGSGFSVLHRRPRDSAWPTPEAVSSSLVADTLGAWLARRLDPDAGAEAAATFLAARLERIDAAARTLARVCRRLRRLVAAAPAWAPRLDAVMNVVEWAGTAFSGAHEGAHPRAVLERAVAEVAA